MVDFENKGTLTFFTYGPDAKLNGAVNVKIARLNMRQNGQLYWVTQYVAWRGSDHTDPESYCRVWNALIGTPTIPNIRNGQSVTLDQFRAIVNSKCVIPEQFEERKGDIYYVGTGSIQRKPRRVRGNNSRYSHMARTGRKANR